MSEKDKKGDSPSEKKPSPKDAPPKPPPEAKEAPKPPPEAKEAPKPPPPPPPPPADPRKDEVMVKPRREGGGNFISTMALAVALGSLLLTGFFAFAKARPRGNTKLVAEIKKTTSGEFKTLTARVAGLEAAVKELKTLGGQAGMVNTLDLKQALVSLREVGKHSSGETTKRVEQVEGALKALINELEAKGR
ncbi:MAG: hypothetical protein O6916_05175 [bacterium]|nr:hypothetical protein [bacterium]MDV2479551.1 hypothetical protein [bacterium]